ncbi:MAG TPA: NlpC/P60 family protein [Pseudolabrys sp.]|nr:NlpC/P60 family protein [Pseudolabrys sp.]
MVALDPRINPFRPEIAASHLRGQVEAKRFVEGVRHQVIEPATAVRRLPGHDARLDTEALFGETAVVYETTDEGWAWGQLETDGYVGWLARSALASGGAAASHKISVPRAFAFPGPDIKLAPVAALPMGARLAVARQDERFAITPSGWHVPEVSLVPVKARQPDFVTVAEQFLNTPYLWGGKTWLGLDCSGLVQISLQAAGISCPRDSDMQELTLGKISSIASLRRGDLLFWKGHVAIARDSETLIHANAHHMMVASEPAAEAIARIKAAGSEVTAVKRVA